MNNKLLASCIAASLGMHVADWGRPANVVMRGGAAPDFQYDLWNLGVLSRHQPRLLNRREIS